VALTIDYIRLFVSGEVPKCNQNIWQPKKNRGIEIPRISM